MNPPTQLDDDFEDQLADLQAARDEELDPELVEWLDEEGALGMPVLRHPLVVQIAPLNGWANKAFRYKQKALAAAIDKGDLHSIVFLHERPYRTWALLEYVVGTDEDGRPLPLYALSPEVRELAASVWIDSENLHQYADEWTAMLTAPAGFGLVLCDDRESFDALPDVLHIHRGNIEDGGFSWSLDENVAAWFANRFDKGHDLVSGTVAKADVTGYLTGRNEHEVIVLDESKIGQS